MERAPGRARARRRQARPGKPGGPQAALVQAAGRDLEVAANCAGRSRGGPEAGVRRGAGPVLWQGRSGVNRGGRAGVSGRAGRHAHEGQQRLSVAFDAEARELRVSRGPGLRVAAEREVAAAEVHPTEPMPGSAHRIEVRLEHLLPVAGAECVSVDRGGFRERAAGHPAWDRPGATDITIPLPSAGRWKRCRRARGFCLSAGSGIVPATVARE